MVIVLLEYINLLLLVIDNWLPIMLWRNGRNLSSFAYK